MYYAKKYSFKKTTIYSCENCAAMTQILFAKIFLMTSQELNVMP